MGSNFFSGLLSTVFNRKSSKTQLVDGTSIKQLCDSLVNVSGEVSGINTARKILATYAAMENQSKVDFFKYLTDDLDLDASELEKCTVAYGKSRTLENFEALHSAAEPKRQELFRRINQAPGATAALVKMRFELLDFLKENPSFARTDLDLTHLLTSWFNRGFLVLRRINWETPANLLEKIIEYEAVHTINDWDDLRRRLQPPDRRCFAFFHPTMPDEPLIFVEVALSRGIPTSIQDVLAKNRTGTNIEQADTAVFYSISNCQGGLKGISLGNSLIKQVVEDLSWELPQLKTFVTLSPIPKFNKWLESVRKSEPLADEILSKFEEKTETDIRIEVKKNSDIIQLLAAKFISEGKRPDGLPIDSVARFHLGNGAMLHNVHVLADMSDNGLEQSCSAMVNYLYEIKKVEQNHEDFVTNGTIAKSRNIDNILRTQAQINKNRIHSND